MPATRDVSNEEVILRDIPSRDVRRNVNGRDIPSRDVRRDVNGKNMALGRDIPNVDFGREVRRDVNDNNMALSREIPSGDIRKVVNDLATVRNDPSRDARRDVNNNNNILAILFPKRNRYAFMYSCNQRIIFVNQKIKELESL
jgi:hypothetical protein